MSSTKPLEPKVGLGPNSAITGVHAAYGLLAVAWLCVGMKLSLKVIQDRHKWKAHDYFAMLATVFATAEVIVIGIDVEHYGEGQHMSTVPKGNLNHVLRLLSHMYIMYEMALMFIKLSILSFYLALFQIKPTFRYTTYFIMAFVVVYLTIFIFIDAFRCTPVKKMWYPVSVKGGHCLDGVLEQRAFGILNVLTDFTILLLPFPVLLRLQMSKTKMLMVGVIFALGLFTCGAAITRTVIIWETLQSKDATWSVGPEITWMTVEMLVGLICGSLLSSPQLFRHVLRETKVGQSLISLIYRRSRGSHERLPDNNDNDKMRNNMEDGRSWELTSKRSFPSSSIGRGRGSDAAESLPATKAKDGQIGVQRTVDVSAETV